MRSVVFLALAAIILAGPARADDHDGDKHHGGHERGFERHGDRGDYGRFERHDDHWDRDGRGFEQRRYREREQYGYGYARPPAYYPSPGQFYPPPVYASPGLNLFVPFR